MESFRRIVIVGAGAIGCYVGVQLHKAGHRPVLLGSFRIAEAVSRGGLILSYPDDRQETYAPGELTMTADYSVCSEASLVIVAVKGTRTAQVIEQLRPCLAADAVLLTIQNGVANGTRLREAFPAHQVFEGMITANVVALNGDNECVEFRLSRSGEIYIPQMHQTALLSLMGVAGLPVKLVDDIQGVLWSKLLLNLVNPLNALSGLPLRDNLYDRNFRLLWRDCIREAIRVMDAAGITPRRVSPLPPRLLPFMLSLPDILFTRIAKRMTDMDAKAKTSMAQDLERGRVTENDYLSKAVIELGRRCGMPTPLNSAVYASMLKAEKGQVAPAQLYRRLLAEIE